VRREATPWHSPSSSFIDEVAIAAGKDPLQYRIDLFGEPRVLPSPRGGPFGPQPGFDTGRASGVLELVREKSGWGKRTLPKGTGMEWRSITATWDISQRWCRLPSRARVS